MLKSGSNVPYVVSYASAETFTYLFEKQVLCSCHFFTSGVPDVTSYVKV
jgi:hypothetical protein